MSPTGPAPGWYPSPDGQGKRWWDGERWTSTTQDPAGWSGGKIAFVTVGIIVGVLVVITLLGMSLSETTETTTGPIGNPSGPPIATVPQAPVTAPPPTAPPVTAPPGPAQTFDDGTWEVGVDIAPGTYRAPNSGGGFCYVDVRNGVGMDADYLDQQLGDGPKIIEATVGTFVNSSGCGRWALS